MWQCKIGKKVRCQNYIVESHHNSSNRCWNIAAKLAIIQHKNPKQQRIWICDGCFKLRFLNDSEFTDQLLQIINLSNKE
jgi:hypothetical protein